MEKPVLTTEKPVLVVYSIGEQIEECAAQIFKRLARTQRYTCKFGQVWEINEEEKDSLSLLNISAFVSRVHKYFDVRKKEQNEDGEYVLKKTVLLKSKADILMNTEEIRLLPTIELVLHAPCIRERDDKLEILENGLYKGGIRVITDMTIKYPLERAKACLLELLQDFKFATPSDKAAHWHVYLFPRYLTGT